MGAANTSSSRMGHDDETKGRPAESTGVSASATGAASVIGSDCDTISAWVERKSTCPESSTTVTMVEGEGMLEASEPQRNPVLTWPTRVPRTSPRLSMRRSRKVRAGRPSPCRLVMSGRPSCRFSRSDGDRRRALLQPAEDGQMDAVVAVELERVEAPARQQVEAAVEEPVGLGGPPRHLQLKDHVGWNALEGRVEQQQPLVDREAERLVGLVETPLALAPELPRHARRGGEQVRTDAFERLDHRAVHHGMIKQRLMPWVAAHRGLALALRFGVRSRPR